MPHCHVFDVKLLLFNLCPTAIAFKSARSKLKAILCKTVSVAFFLPIHLLCIACCKCAQYGSCSQKQCPIYLSVHDSHNIGSKRCEGKSEEEENPNQQTDKANNNSTDSREKKESSLHCGSHKKEMKEHE